MTENPANVADRILNNPKMQERIARIRDQATSFGAKRELPKQVDEIFTKEPTEVLLEFCNKAMDFLQKLARAFPNDLQLTAKIELLHIALQMTDHKKLATPVEKFFDFGFEYADKLLARDVHVLTGSSLFEDLNVEAYWSYLTGDLVCKTPELKKKQTAKLWGIVAELWSLSAQYHLLPPTPQGRSAMKEVAKQLVFKGKPDQLAAMNLQKHVTSAMNEKAIQAFVLVAEGGPIHSLLMSTREESK